MNAPVESLPSSYITCWDVILQIWPQLLSEKIEQQFSIFLGKLRQVLTHVVYPNAYGIPLAGAPMKWNLGVSRLSSSSFQPPIWAKKPSKAARKSANFG